jgi:hypothetical protein
MYRRSFLAFIFICCFFFSCCIVMTEEEKRNMLIIYISCWSSSRAALNRNSQSPLTATAHKSNNPTHMWCNPHPVHLFLMGNNDGVPRLSLSCRPNPPTHPAKMQITLPLPSPLFPILRIPHVDKPIATPHQNKGRRAIPPRPPPPPKTSTPPSHPLPSQPTRSP